MCEIRKYIENGFEKCVRKNTNDDGTLIGLPYPYVVPSIEAFNELYYWDTYFTNLGLLKIGKQYLAKSNTDNILWLVDKYGFMPNGNRTFYLDRSQPPFLSLMVKDIYKYYGDKVWLGKAYRVLKKEYDFWMTKRITPTGLNGYDCKLTLQESKQAVKFYWLRSRVGADDSIGDQIVARHGLASAESGWDMNPRWGFEAYNFAHVDLNSLLYLLERNMSYFACELQNSEQEKWDLLSQKRKTLMNSFMLDNNNLFFDYNFVKNNRANIFSVASIYPLFVKLATDKQAQSIVNSLDKIEQAYGITCCEQRDSTIKYQWDYPNGWPCLQYIVVKALENYGYTEHSERIANKYISLVENQFEKTGRLWEKYNVVEGNIKVQNEYEMPNMLGWTAGVYLALKK